MQNKRKGCRYEKKEVILKKGQGGRILTKRCWSCEAKLFPGDNYLQELVVFSDGKERMGRIFCMDKNKKCREKAVEINSHGNCF